MKVWIANALAASAFSLVTLSGAFATPSSANVEMDFGRQVWAECAGGPAKPAYAFRDRTGANSARHCADVIARFSPDCRRSVRVGRCFVERWAVNQTPAGYCQCDPRGGRYIGEWR